jgi:hypothetical protein
MTQLVVADVQRGWAIPCALGEVSYLISPNKLHHLFLAEWLEAYPSAKSYAAPGLKEKRPDLRFDGDLREAAEPAWGNEIAQTLFRGSLAMEEALFFHKASHTLLLTDLIENFDPSTLAESFSWLMRERKEEI